ncbi:hypothetical protein OUZ56_031484 [Daphnia magna]|uniref:Uncharacterized protein n=1 Tax=Daphnia magna TaxID=35525 RepID=A0ABQ9ZUD0_9CRUS|nr:hypothetical protein OUZ56_031484 [Daphnia magna]
MENKSLVAEVQTNKGRNMTKKERHHILNDSHRCLWLQSQLQELLIHHFGHTFQNTSNKIHRNYPPFFLTACAQRFESYWKKSSMKLKDADESSSILFPRVPHIYHKMLKLILVCSECTSIVMYELPERLSIPDTSC